MNIMIRSVTDIRHVDLYFRYCNWKRLTREGGLWQRLMGMLQQKRKSATIRRNEMGGRGVKWKWQRKEDKVVR